MIRIALAGYGTVGQGVMELFSQRKNALQRRLGKRVDIHRVLVRDPSKKREIDERGATFTSDAWEIVSDESVQIIVEATGDIDLSYVLIKEALKRKKHVITANKSLLSLHLEELSELAQRQGVYLLYEASVGGGTPLIKPLQELSQYGEIQSFRGLLSGSCNHVLTKMRNEQVPYEEAIEEAKALGYLEADPTDDVGGFDTRRKLRILSTLAFGTTVEEKDISLEGITHLRREDIQTLAQMGYAVRLLAQAHRVGDRVQAAVHPAALPLVSFLGSMDGADNGVEFFGENFLHISFQGSGAGRYPTAHAMLADLEDVLFAHRRKESPLGKARLLKDPFNRSTRFYIRSAAPIEVALEEQVGEDLWLSAPIAYQKMKSAMPPGALVIPLEP